MKSKLTFLAIIISISTSIAQSIHSYDWKSVTINGGGYVPGFVFSKATPNLLYARTDVGGIYRWDHPNKKWIPLSDFVTSGNQLGVISIAADPVDSNRVYMATGLYTNSWDPNGVFYSSTNKGETWTRSEAPFKVGGNEAGRGTGERLQVDPNMPNKLLFASQKQGVFQSLDYGKTWSKVTSFPKLNCTFLEIDPSSGTKGTASKDIYVGTYDHLASNDTTIGGLYKSTDAGTTWTYWSGQFAKVEPKDFDKPKISTPAIPNILAFTGDNIFITMGNNLAPGTSNGYVVKYNKTAKTWTKIFPFSKNTQGGYNSLSVHPTNPNIVVVGTLGYWWPTSDRVYITVDGGTTWTDVRTKMKTNNKNTPHGGGMGWNSGLKINPYNPSQAVFGSGNGLWMTNNLDKAFTNDSTLWTYENDNFEETVPLSLASPPTGAELISGLGDISGFVHLDVTKSPANTYHQHGNTYCVDFAENNPNIIVRSHDGGKRASISKNNGVTWTDFTSQAIGGDTRENWLSISPDGKNIIWAPSDSFPSVSNNDGATWTLCSGLAENVFPKSDRVNSNIFYAINNTTGGFFKSTDGAKTFTKTAATFSFTTGGKIVTVFGKEGHVWLSAGSNGLHYTTDGGTTFAKISGVEEVYNLTFGKAKTGSTYPAVFIFGKISGLVGLYRSDDMGVNWIKINTENQEFGRGYSRCMAGDPKVYGRLYIGTGGRGILYGQPEGSGNCFSPNLASAPSEICKSATISLDSKIADKAYKFSWYKDNVKLPDTTSIITIGHAANYSVTATKTGCAPTTSTKTITSRLIDVDDVQVCKGNNATIAINGTSTYAWYDANNTAIDTALSLTIKPSASTQYTIKDIAFNSYSLGLPAYTTSGWGLGGSFDAGQNVAQLTVIDDVKLKGISLKVNGAGTKGVIRILDADGNIVTTSTKTNLAVGMQEIPFDIVLTAGVYKIDAVGTTGNVQFQADRTNIVLSIPNYATYAPVSWGNGIFFNLKFDVGNTCAPTPVAITVHELPVITNNINTTKLGWQKLSTANVCAGTNVQFAPWPVKSNGWSWQGPKSFTSTLRNPSINNLTTDQSGNYTATYVDSNGCSASAIYTITVNELPTATITSPSISFCLGSALLLTASTGSSYVWKNGTTQVGTAATYSTSTVGTFTVEVTNTNGCKAVSAVKTITGITPTLWYQDLDNDGKGDSLNKISACTKPTGYVADKSDLCPTDPLKINPGTCGCGKPENCIITDIETSIKESIFVYPNPFHQQFTIEIEGKFQYTLEDMNGKMLLKGNGENHLLIENNLQTGVYLLKVSTNNNTSNIKIVKN